MELLEDVVMSEKMVTKKNALIFVVGLLVGVLGLVLLSPETRIEIRLGGSTHASDRGLDSFHERTPGRPPTRSLIGYQGRAPGRMLRRLGTSLDLSDEQTESLEALFQTQREQFGEIRRDMRQQLDTRREAFQTSVAEILTPAQMELFEEQFRGRRNRGHASRHPRRR